MKHHPNDTLALRQRTKTFPSVTKQLVKAYKVSWVNLASITWLRPGGRALAGGEGGARSRARSWQIRLAGDRRGRREEKGWVCVCLPASPSPPFPSFSVCLSLSLFFPFLTRHASQSFKDLRAWIKVAWFWNNEKKTNDLNNLLIIHSLLLNVWSC